MPRLEREKRELKEDQDELSQRKMEEWGSHAETVLSLFGGRRRSVSTQEVEEISSRWGEIAGDITEIPVRPYKKDVLLEMFGVAWLPHYVVVQDGELVELPGYKFE
jgi:hypothetical protein